MPCFQIGTMHHLRAIGLLLENRGPLVYRARPTVLSKEFRIGTWTFACKDVVPLQAADTLAYEIFKQVENQIVDRGEKRDVRFSVKDLIRAQDLPYMKYWNRDRLVEWLRNSQERGVLNEIKRKWS